MQCFLNWKVKYTPGPEITSETYIGDVKLEEGTVLKDGPNPNYPELLGEIDMTSSLTGYGLTVVPGRITANSSHQYDSPHVLFETWLYGTIPTKGSGAFSYPSEFSNVEERINVGLLNKASSKINEFQGGVFIAEIRETLQLLRRPVANIAALCTAFKKREAYFQHQLKDLDRWRDKLSAGQSDALRRRLIDRRYKERYNTLERLWGEEWLKFHFGIMPLISDAEDAVARLNRITAKRKRARVTFRLEEGTENNISLGPNSAYGWQWTEYQSTYYSARGTGQALVEVLQSESAFDLGNWGLTSSQVIPTLYEVIPWSFALDYFTNVNEILNSYFVEEGRLVWAWAGIELKGDRVVWANDFQFSLDGPGTVSSFVPWRLTRRDVKRWKPSSDYAFLAYHLEFPGLKQGLNLAALTAALRH